MLSVIFSDVTSDTPTRKSKRKSVAPLAASDYVWNSSLKSKKTQNACKTPINEFKSVKSANSTDVKALTKHFEMGADSRKLDSANKILELKSKKPRSTKQTVSHKPACRKSIESAFDVEQTEKIVEQQSSAMKTYLSLNDSR